MRSRFNFRVTGGGQNSTAQMGEKTHPTWGAKARGVSGCPRNLANITVCHAVKTLVFQERSWNIALRRVEVAAKTLNASWVW